MSRDLLPLLSRILNILPNPRIPKVPLACNLALISFNKSYAEYLGGSAIGSASFGSEAVQIYHTF